MIQGRSASQLRGAAETFLTDFLNKTGIKPQVNRQHRRGGRYASGAQSGLPSEAEEACLPHYPREPGVVSRGLSSSSKVTGWSRHTRCLRSSSTVYITGMNTKVNSVATSRPPTTAVASPL